MTIWYSNWKLNPICIVNNILSLFLIFPFYIWMPLYLQAGIFVFYVIVFITGGS